MFYSSKHKIEIEMPGGTPIIEVDGEKIARLVMRNLNKHEIEIEMLKDIIDSKDEIIKTQDKRIEALKREIEAKDEAKDATAQQTDGDPKYQYVWYLGKRFRCEMTHAEATEEYGCLTHEFTFREC